MFRKSTFGFTLIELLIVVAIIAILAAIAVPNFLEAQVRSKVTRSKSDMRAIAVALEAYRSDSNTYPPDGRAKVEAGWSQDQVNAYLLLQVVTTPVAYMTSIPKDSFQNRWLGGARANEPWSAYFTFRSERQKELLSTLDTVQQYGKPASAVWSLLTIGPDQQPNWGEYAIFGEDCVNHVVAWNHYGCLYDATNGSISAGDIVRVGP